MSQISLDLFNEFMNTFCDVNKEFKKLLERDDLNGSITLCRDVWKIKDLLDWCYEITNDNIKVIKQINFQLSGEFGNESIYFHEEIKKLKKENFNLKYLIVCCKHFNADLKFCLQNIKLIKNESAFRNIIPKIYAELSHYRLMLDHNIYYSILSANQNDIMMYMDDIDHPEHTILKQRLEYLNILATPEQVRDALQKFDNLNNLTNCTISRTYSKNFNFVKVLKELFWIVYYFLQPKKAQIETKVFQVNPGDEYVIEIWNVFSRLYLMKMYLKLCLTSINQHLKIYVPAVFEPITLGEIKERNTSQTMFENLKSDLNNIPEPINYNRYAKNENSTFPQNNNKSPEGHNIWSDYDIFDKKSKNSIKVRVLSNIPLIPREKIDSENLSSKQKKTQPKIIEEIVYHIHGGGWIGVDTFSHQMYTRKLANQLKNIPIFSVEYSLAPENRYPKPLDDCWQVYQFLLNGIEEYFENVKVRKIIFMGDSAGGNMALSICLLALQRGIRRPDGIVLSYPALNLRMDFFTPSFVNIFNEIIVPFHFLRICLGSYMDRNNPDVDPALDPLLSPILFSDKVLSLLPPIRMACGDKDILRDDCIRFLYRLVKLNHNVKMVLYRELTHGYLNLDLPLVLPATSKCAYDCGIFIQQLLSDEVLEPIVFQNQQEAEQIPQSNDQQIKT